MKKSPLFVLFFTLLLVAIGFGIVIPVLPYYTEQIAGTANDPHSVGLIVGLLMASYSAMGFIFAPIWGRISDRVGRKRILLVGIGGYALHFVIFGLATSIWLLFVARIAGGVLAAAAIPTAMAYVGDVTTPEKRSRGMGMMGAAMGLGVVIGPGIGGLTAGLKLPGLSTPYATPYFLAAGLAIVTMLFAMRVLPESKPTEVPERKGFMEAMGTEGRKLWPVFLLTFMQMFAFTGFEATFILFAQQRFQMTVTQVGGLFALMGLLGALVQGGGAGRMINRMGEAAVIRMGIFIYASGFLLLAWAPSALVCGAVMCYTGLGSAFLRPAFSTWVSKVSTTGQGTALGLLSSTDSLARVFGPAIGGALFVASPLLPYQVGGGLMVVALLFSMVALPRLRQDPTTAAVAGAAH